MDEYTKRLEAEFQSTHLREVRCGTATALVDAEDFNPRTYVRCDSNGDQEIVHAPVFQSTHLREVR